MLSDEVQEDEHAGKTSAEIAEDEPSGVQVEDCESEQVAGEEIPEFGRQNQSGFILNRSRARIDKANTINIMSCNRYAASINPTIPSKERKLTHGTATSRR